MNLTIISKPIECSNMFFSSSKTKRVRV